MNPLWLLAAAYLFSAAVSAMPAPKPLGSRAYAAAFHVAHVLAADLSRWLARQK